MGLFGGSSTTTTKVRPSKQVEDILKNVVSQTQNMPQGSYTPYELAQMNSTQQGALANLASNPELQKVASLYGGRTAQGLQQLSQSNQNLQNILNNPTTAAQVQEYAQQVSGKNGLGNRALSQGLSGSGAIKSLGGGAALRSAGRRNTSNMTATAQNQLSQQGQSQGINQLFGNTSNAMNANNLMEQQAQANLGFGTAGLNASQQAMMNQLQAGGIQQQQEQAQATNQWQNQMGAQQYDWNQINNKLNVLNEVSPMAGYTTTGISPGISKSQQLLGAAQTGLGIAGKLGYLGNSANALQNNLDTGKQTWTGLKAGTTQTDSIGGIPVYSQGGGSMWSNAGKGMLGALGGMFGGGQ